MGLTGIALLVASLVFLVSTHLPLAHEIENLSSQLTVARVRTVDRPAPVRDHGIALLRSLPSRAQMPALLGLLLKQADAAHLSIDTGKYETTALKTGGVMTYQVSFPIVGSYPQVRQFIDATLTALPAVAMSELSLTRKTIGDGEVEAQIRLTAFTQDSP
jgi:Tfp pilus assembly protein PilO